MVLAADASIFTWSDTPITAKIETTTITTGDEGRRGRHRHLDGRAEHRQPVPVVLDGSIKPPDAWWRLTHFSELKK